jgi:hypothetical protein
MRVALNASLAGWMRTSAPDSVTARILEQKRKALDYYRALGFTHILYPMEWPYAGAFGKRTGEWIYNGGDYAHGDHAESLSAMKREAEARGMLLVPAVECLSHVQAYITLDPSISEFDAKNPKPPPPWLWSDYEKRGYRAYDGIASAGPLGANPGADQFFREYMRIIKAVWAASGSRGPERVMIGHDELGYGTVSLLKAGKSRRKPETASELVAAEIHARYTQVTEILGPQAGLFLFGDSFVPGDYGETYGLTGDLRTGAGGTLDLLRSRYEMAGKFAVIPWIYSSRESDGPEGGRGLSVSKRRQLDYLDRLGVAFLVGTGEDQSQPYAPPLERTQLCLFEWVREARAHPDHLLGFANLTYNPFDACRKDSSALPLCSGFSAALLASLVWKDPEAAKALNEPYSMRTFRRVDYRKIRWEGRWAPSE